MAFFCQNPKALRFFWVGEARGIKTMLAQMGHGWDSSGIGPGIMAGPMFFFGPCVTPAEAARAIIKKRLGPDGLGMVPCWAVLPRRLGCLG